MPDWSIWLIVAIFFAVAEILVFTGFVFGPLAGAAVVTAIVAAAGAGIEIQLAVFAVTGIASILLLRPLAKRNFGSPDDYRTNADALIGREAPVLRPITRDNPGLIRLANEDWSAEPAPGIDTIHEGARVRVVKITGATAVVEALEPPQPEPPEGTDL